MFRKTLIVIAMLAVLPSCLDETTKPAREAVDSTWPAMTSENDLIDALQWCYENPGKEEAMARYASLLHSEYFFYLDPEDVSVGDSRVITRAEDIESTEWIFACQTMLELELTSTGSWYPRIEIDGSPCDGCLETTRTYFIRAQFEKDGTIFQSPPERAFATIVIAPDESDSSKWIIRAIYDIRMR